MKKILLAAMAASIFTMTACSGGTGSEGETAADTALDTTSASVTEYAEIKYEIDPSKPVVALTFDDGPNLTTTVQILDLLEEKQVRASFFLIGNNIDGVTSRVVDRAYQMGCEIANHSQTHSYLNQMEAEAVIQEVQSVSDKVEEITGEPTRFFRPPYIAVNETMYANIDMPFICGAGCNDWDDNVSVQDRIDKTLAQVQDGTIILLHDSAGNVKTVEALETIIPALLDEGYQFVTVSELFEAKGVEISADDTNLYTIVQ